MPVTIVRTDWIDDDGTGTVGTVINNAWKTEMYNQIDQALAKVPMLAGNNTLTGNQTIAGTLNVNGFGLHTFLAGGVGGNALRLQNSLQGASNYAAFFVGNDLDANLLTISSYSSNYGAGYANKTQFTQSQAGLIFNASNAVGTIQFLTNAALRWGIDALGALWCGTQGGGVGNQFTSLYSAGGVIYLGNPGSAATTVLYFYNATGLVGSIQTSGAGTSYLQSSDARLKTDRGLARDTSVLERTEIHDYDWIADGSPGRGVFSQDAHKVAPFANAPGTDERDDEGRLVRPWSTDYSKYVPDLIVGWQQHREQLAALRAELDGLKGLN